ncbi:MAG: TraR/DksA family transcriptional regulator [Boseongicola sp. SB0667_bin_21]|nr:TraR/DksA family transcriptional regulator [Boseongicola sp. SB0667_bin_21]
MTDSLAGPATPEQIRCRTRKQLTCYGEIPLNALESKTYRDALLAERSRLANEDAASAEGRGTVMLDQQSVGRLSRMDAMQRQAMAQATMRRRATRRAKIDAALRRIDEDEFGFCQKCGDDIAQARLDIDATALTCVACATGD